jgi:hypothetical protein
MYCTQCGSEIEQHARFCQKCGSDVSSVAPAAASPVPPVRKADHDMGMHMNILSWLLIGSGVLTAFGALMLLFAGQVLRHMPIAMMREMDMPAGLPPFVSWIAGVLGIGALCLAGLSIAAGVGLMQYQSWARAFAIIVAVLSLFHFPIGTVIGIYAFWVLLSQEGQQYYKSRSESTMTASGI